MAKTGRPSKKTPELVEQLVSLLEDGDCLESACGTVGIDSETFQQWSRDDAAFSATATRARLEAKRRALEVLRKSMTDGANAVTRPDKQASDDAKFWLKYAGQWQFQPNKHEHTGKDGGPIVTDDLSGLKADQIRAMMGDGEED